MISNAIDHNTDCSICMTNKKTVELQCKHTLCENCVTSLEQCPYCRTHIDHYILIRL